jgi:methylenetetrahydrofolate reductase (NADPH)
LREPTGLLRKINAGAQFVQTQFCMDANVLRRYMTCLTNYGILQCVHFLASARCIREKLLRSVIPECIIARPEAASDPKAEGRRICMEIMREFLGMPGVSGVHIMAPLNEGGSGSDSGIPRVIPSSGG